jgi:hypothetical protein
MANPILTTYDPRLVTVIFGGMPIDGFADGTFVGVEPSADRYTRVVGADGEVTRAKSVDNSHIVTITLLQSSRSNQFLSLVAQADRITSKGVLPLEIVDGSGSTVLAWSQAYIAKDPSWAYAKENTDRTWEFQTGQIAVENKGGTLIGIDYDETDGDKIINDAGLKQE